MEKKSITDTKFWELYTLAGNGIMVNLMFLICSMPLVTIGASWCGLYSALRYAIRGERWATGFKDGIKTRFLRMTIAWTVLLVPIADSIVRILGIVTAIENGATTLNAELPLIIGNGIFLLFIIMFLAALILLNVYIPTSVKQWLKNGVTLVFRSPLALIVIGILMWLPIATVFLLGLTSFMLLMIYIALYFTVVVFIATIMMKNTLVRIKGEMEELEELIRPEEETYE